jgi:hypothetical protein
MSLCFNAFDDVAIENGVSNATNLANVLVYIGKAHFYFLLANILLYNRNNKVLHSRMAVI